MYLQKNNSFQTCQRPILVIYMGHKDYKRLLEMEDYYFKLELKRVTEEKEGSHLAVNSCVHHGAELRHGKRRSSAKELLQFTSPLNIPVLNNQARSFNTPKNENTFSKAM